LANSIDGDQVQNEIPSRVECGKKE
jgi:hypothetical protein